MIDGNYILDFGMHKGTALANVPASYLLWLKEQTWFASEKYKELRGYISENMDAIELEEARKIRERTNESRRQSEYFKKH